MIRYLTLVNSRNTFVFKWDGRNSLDELHAALKRLARNPEMDFDWEDAMEMFAQSKELEAMLLERTQK
jgi:hypothetical protein